MQLKLHNAGAACQPGSKSRLLEAAQNQAAGSTDWESRSQAACCTARDNRCALSLGQHLVSVYKMCKRCNSWLILGLLEFGGFVCCKLMSSGEEVALYSALCGFVNIGR